MFALVPPVPTESSTLNRTPPIPISHELLAKATKTANRLLSDGLLKAGIKASTIEKLQVLEDLAPSSGEFLIASLDLTHKMMVLQGTRLFEEAERIKTDYLDDPCLDDEYKIKWQSAYNDICEQLGKCYDRTLTGTQALARILGTEKDTKRKKPGFTPLKRVHKVK